MLDHRANLLLGRPRAGGPAVVRIFTIRRSPDFLASTDVVDWYHADVRTLGLAGGESDRSKCAAVFRVGPRRDSA